MDQTFKEASRRQRRLLLRGESAVAFIGIAVAAILLAAMAASGWWTLRTQRQTLQAARVREVRAVATSLAQSGEVMISAGEMSALRRIINDTAANYELAECRITLAENQILADAEPAHINIQHLPATWADTSNTAETQNVSKETVELTLPMSVAGRGNATLHIAAPIVYPFFTFWEAQAGVGAIGALTMVALLLVYRRMRLKLRAMGAIREALLSVESAGSNPAMLRVNDEFGAEAQAWNQILAEKEQMRQRSVAERAKDALSNRRAGKGDLDAAFDAMSQGLILVDEKMKVKYSNGAAATFLGTKREQATGQDFSTLVADEKILQAVRATASGVSRRRISIEIERLGEGGGVLRFGVRPVRREDSAAAMVVIEDITQQRAAEESRHAFVAQVTHELRTPLTNIRLYVETAIEDGEGDPQLQTKCLNVINVEARRLERIVGDMLSVAEIEAGSLKLRIDDVQLETVFAELKDDYSPQAEVKNVVLTINIPPKFPKLKGDRDKIVLALHNLVGNAIKYTPEGGKVEVNVQADEKELVVNVADTGIGIKPDDIDHIFDKFYRAKDPRLAKIIGSGLGLTLAREVTRLHGGDITVQSQLDKGSTFRMTLPAIAEAA